MLNGLIFPIGISQVRKILWVDGSLDLVIWSGFLIKLFSELEMSGHACLKFVRVQVRFRTPKKSCVRVPVCFGNGLGHELMSEVVSVSVHICSEQFSGHNLWLINTPCNISEIKFSTKVARIMAFTLTKMRDTIITHVNKQSDKIQKFKEDSINKLVTYDCLKVCQGSADTFDPAIFIQTNYFRISWNLVIG